MIRLSSGVQIVKDRFGGIQDQHAERRYNKSHDLMYIYIPLFSLVDIDERSAEEDKAKREKGESKFSAIVVLESNKIRIQIA